MDALEAGAVWSSVSLVRLVSRAGSVEVVNFETGSSLGFASFAK
jgi:hypothetical protein